jgi:hypothetical protein
LALGPAGEEARDGAGIWPVIVEKHKIRARYDFDSSFMALPLLRFFLKFALPPL